MKREDNIIVPRWFLEVVENTLRIQYNINEPDKKKTGESCQDRNIHQSLNGIRKLLKGEELTGMERLEKFQPSLPSNLDEEAQKVEDYYDVGEEHECLCCHRGDIKDAFKTGAEWMAGQGETHELTVESPVLGPPMICCPVRANNGDKVIVQIRKK